MRLINARTLLLEEFQDSNLPSYAILSHTWEDDEISFEDMQKTLSPTRQGWLKIQFACAQARQDALTHVWVDTCCIDKRSSAELQEAINSMFRYYSDADMCYAYLSDMPAECPNLEIGEMSRLEFWNKCFKESRWFTRGWTLQELIAPREVIFFGRKWNYLAKKSNLITIISAITSISGSILTHSADPSSMSVAQRMSWASHRRTTRVEDQAYSLLGIFNVSIPMLYGEGAKAFTRLQEEILKTYTDHSIFAWEFNEHSPADGSLLATSPMNFANSGRIVQLGKPGAFEMTNRGLRIALRTLDCSSEHAETLAILKCRYVNDLSRSLALRLRKYGGGHEYHAIKHTPTQPYGYEPHLIKRRGKPTSRLMFVRAEDLKLAQDASSLQITREFEPEASKLKFWIPMTAGEFQIVETHPEKSWDANDGIMHSSEEQRVRGAVTIETSLGNRFVIAFGFDRLIKKIRRDDSVYELDAHDSRKEDAADPVHGSVGNGETWSTAPDSGAADVQDANVKEGQDLKEDHITGEDEYDKDGVENTRHFLPGIWSSPWKSSSSPQNIYQIVQSSQTDCTHDNQSCANHACPHMPAFTQIHEFKVSERMEARIRTEKIMEDTVFRIDVSLVQMHEFEVVENRFELMDTAIAAPKIPMGWSSRMQLIVSSTVPPLLHELTVDELQSPIQVWMRLPRAIGVSEPRPRPFRMLSHRILFWSFQQSEIVAESLLLKTPASLQIGVGGDEDVELFFVGDLFRSWEILALSPRPRDVRSHLEELRDRVRAKAEVGKNPYRDQRLGRTVSTSVPLPRSNKSLWARMRCVRTVHGLACVIDLHLEDLQPYFKEQTALARSPKIENKDSRRDLTLLRDCNEAMSGMQEIEPNRRRWGIVSPDLDDLEPEPVVDIPDLGSLREAQQTGIKSQRSAGIDVDSSDTSEDLRNFLRHMTKVSDGDTTNLRSPYSFSFPLGNTHNSGEADHEENRPERDSSIQATPRDSLSSETSSIHDFNINPEAAIRSGGGRVQIWLDPPQGTQLVSSYPADRRSGPSNIIFWESQDSRSAIGGVILRTTHGSEALLAFVGNEEDSINISVWKTSAYTDLAQTCASLRSKPANTWRSPFLEANLFGSKPGDPSTLYFPSEKALLTAELHRTEFDGIIRYSINVSLDSQDYQRIAVTSATDSQHSSLSAGTRDMSLASPSSGGSEDPLDAHRLIRSGWYSEVRDQLRKLGRDR